jgi:Fe-Mn family superoxide dismutase
LERNPVHKEDNMGKIIEPGTHELPKLGYAYDALEPYIDAETMELHHSKHHQTYVTNLNSFLEQLAEAEHAGDVNKMIALQSAIKFNGGGAVQ